VDTFDIFIAYISWGDSGKTRPVLILEQQETVVFVLIITTQYDNKSQAVRSKYFKINDWKQAGLDKQSYVDTNTVRDLPPVVLAGKPAVGRLTESDVQRLIEFLGNSI
jgi:hypothetical protein